MMFLYTLKWCTLSNIIGFVVCKYFRKYCKILLTRSYSQSISSSMMGEFNTQNIILFLVSSYYFLNVLLHVLGCPIAIPSLFHLLKCKHCIQCSGIPFCIGQCPYFFIVGCIFHIFFSMIVVCSRIPNK